MATLYKIDGTIEEVSAVSGVFSLQELYAYVCPDDPSPIVEAVQIGRGQILWCHEEGKLRDLPLNVRATARYLGLLRPGDFLVGNILITDASEVD